MSQTKPPRVPSSESFIEEIIRADLATGLCSEIVTRFPPEPNGYLHIGHAKSITLNFEYARKFGGRCHLRFDDTNPEKEEHEYIESIIRDVRWLGFDWGAHLYHASDYYEQFYEHAVGLIRKELAYVCDLSPEQIRAHRGTLTEAGRESPFRNRPIEENLDLFGRMRAGEFLDGSRVLRARIDMGSPNINMRDPALYRIRRALHPRTGDRWCIYPMYDFAHPLSDAFEGVTHSLCTLEFDDHRPLYDWVLEACGFTEPRPHQHEFARLNLTKTVMSKRILLRLVREKHVSGWDDPRMPTLAGLRRRGYTPASIRAFCNTIGVARTNSVVEHQLLEHHLREDLNRNARRVMAVLRPIKVVIENYPEDAVEELEAENNPEDPATGTRRIRFCREILIEEDDFRETPPPKYFRLSPGAEVRLKHAYLIRCHAVVKDPDGGILELRCTYDPATRGGNAPDGRKVKGTLHWVSARHAFPAEVRLYDHLLKDEAEADDPLANLNPASLERIAEARVEESLRSAAPGESFQFLRLGYFCPDPESTPERLVFNRSVALKDTWARTESRGK